MDTMQRRGRITYERLTNSLERLHGAIGAQLPDLKDAGRVRDLQQAINKALVTARAGLSGEAVPPPAQLKQETKARIAKIHERHDAIDEVEKHSQANAHVSGLVAPAAKEKHNSSLASSQQPPAPKRARGTRDRSKENAAPPAAPSSQHPVRKLSAVRKTPITQRPISSNPRAPASVTKHSKRSTRSGATPRNTNAQTDEADRRAAAAALLGLAEHSPETSLSLSTPSLSSTGPSRKRAYDDASPPRDSLSREDDTSAPAPKRRMLAAAYAPLPVLGESVSAQRAFVMGVEYAVQHLASHGGNGGAEMRAWVEEGVGLQNAARDGHLKVDGRRSSDGSTGGDVSVGTRPVDGVGKGFWDVV